MTNGNHQLPLMFQSVIVCDVHRNNYLYEFVLYRFVCKTRILWSDFY